jgi:hypothetical protein
MSALGCRLKARAAQNARRHGLNQSVISDRVLSEHVEALAHKIVGKAVNSEVYQLARSIAEPQIDLIRIRQARLDLLASNLSDPDYGKAEAMAYNCKLVTKILPYIDMVPQLLEMLRLPPEGPHKIVAALLDLTKQLRLMDRYERRALSRRKFAIREFDAARQQSNMR